MNEIIISTLKLTYFFLKYSVPGLIIGMVIAELLVELNIINKLSFIGGIFTKIANLPDECGVAITSAFIDPRTASIMLLNFYKNNKISKTELYIAILMTAFPAVVIHWNFYIPLLSATLGILGIAYFGVLLLIGLIETVIFALIGKILIKRDNKRDLRGMSEITEINSNSNNIKDILKKVFTKTLKNSTPIVKTIIIASVLTSFLIEIGVFEYIANTVKNNISFLPVPTEELSISVATMINSIAAYSMAGTLYNNGTINSIQVIRALLLGSVLSSITLIRYLIPHYIGLYGLKDGTNLMVLSLLSRSFLIIIVIAIITYIYNIVSP
jgi:hypothetical protein